MEARGKFCIIGWGKSGDPYVVERPSDGRPMRTTDFIRRGTFDTEQAAKDFAEKNCRENWKVVEF